MKFILLLLCLIVVDWSYGQSDEVFTNYMFDKISFNAGATGLEGAGGTLIYRKHWLGNAGPPNSFLFNAQANLKKQGIGLGISYLRDNIGLFRENDFKVNIAKHFKVNSFGQVSLGLGLGVLHGSFDPDWISGPDVLDLPNANEESAFDVNFGAFWRDTNDRYYVGLSTTHITAPLLKAIYYEKARHYYLTGGMKIGYDMLQIHPSVILKPSFLVVSDLVSTRIDITAIANFALTNDHSMNGGVSYRSKNSVAVLLGYSIFTSNSGVLQENADLLNIGLSYDISTSGLNTPGMGSLEVWLNYSLFGSR